uniref:Reverse transcriptase domain-containing protein n=1 Tax=Biomphalaria glabrata TaxID=6526 RepID=A0A2C9KJZ6_BIOGL
MYTNIRKNVQKQLHLMQDTWLSKKVETIQEFADKHDMKNFHAINEVYGPTKSGSSPILNGDATILLTDKDEILKRWAEHFEKVLKTPSIINEVAIDRLQQVPINEKMDDPHMLKETDLAIQQLAHGKAPGSDSIPIEVYKKGGLALIERLHELFFIMWEQESIPQDFIKIPQLSIYTSKKETAKSLTTTKEYLFPLLLGKYLHTFY